MKGIVNSPSKLYPHIHWHVSILDLGGFYKFVFSGAKVLDVDYSTGLYLVNLIYARN